MKKYTEIRFEGNILPTKSLKRVRHLFSRQNRSGQLTCMTPSGQIHIWVIQPIAVVGQKASKSKRKKGGDSRRKRTLINVRARWVGIKKNEPVA